MQKEPLASLFGIEHSNRDFSREAPWGKNQFNSSFPASLCCYLASKGLSANYLTIVDGNFTVSEEKIENIFGTTFENSNIFYSFETAFSPYQLYVTGNLPRTDLIIQDRKTGECIRSLEVKLTALPDNTTHTLIDNLYGSEIVVRPDTIVYLACSIIDSLQDDLKSILSIFNVEIKDWTDPKEVISHIEKMNACIEQIAKSTAKNDIPFLLQPIWKTQGKSPKLSENCLDVFVWSNSGFSWFISQNCNIDPNARSITRHTRTSIWLYKMLYDFTHDGIFDCSRIIDNLSYNTKNDKAFASSGVCTNKYMKCENLTTPRITCDEIKNIILGGGQKLLSPERRFDAIIYNSPELFS